MNIKIQSYLMRKQTEKINIFEPKFLEDISVALANINGSWGKTGKTCGIIYIAKLDDSRESALLIQDMFPILEEYKEREYTIAGKLPI